MDRDTIFRAAQAFIQKLRALESGETGASERLAQLFREDAELSNPLMQHHGGPIQGRSQIAAFWHHYRLSFASIHSEFGEVTTSERAAGLFWRSRGTDAEGHPVDYEGVSLLCFDAEGKIERFRGYFDSAQLRVRAA